QLLIAQQSIKIYTSDIDNFWIAYDSINKAKDYQQKLKIINTLYINKGTKGLHQFMEMRYYTDSVFVDAINNYPKFFNSIRENTLLIKKKEKDLENGIKKFKKIYPELKDAEMYFTIGGLRSGGTVSGNMVLVGAEIAMGNASTDVSEFENDWYENTFKNQSNDKLIFLNLHEYVHTQQKDYTNTLILTQAIREGACDFMTELILKSPLNTSYSKYGRANLEELKVKFKQEMFSSDLSNWFYNGLKMGEKADLGYYIGYEISKSYYQNSKNKKQAIIDIIELDYNNEQKVENFLRKSKFFEEGFDREKIMLDYENNKPTIVKIEPFENNADDVDSTTKELKITFSKEMDPSKISIKFGEKGKINFPMKKVNGYENNNKTLVFELELEPKKEYEFLITNENFKSKDGYQLKEKELLVRFKTR
ncbi:MAG: Ig-like domain-containing protein, partial [Flavobacteriaceae bacterium]|nr:Ig-like domain-containing protein [Candidatus Onthonaster equi]